MSQQIKKVQKIIFVVSLALLPLTCILCLCLGRYHLSVMQVAQAIFQPDSASSITKAIVFNLRVPRIILAICCGAGLSVSGLAFQSLFSNPLATADTLGTASGACFGAVLAMVLGLNIFFSQILALIFGLLGCLLAWSLGSKRGETSIASIILAGIMISAIFQAFLAILKYIADPEDVLPSITYWLLGSMASVTQKSLIIGLPFIIAGIIILWMLKWKLNILALSEDEAISLGMNVKLTRFLVILASSMITASCVSMCGQIGWIGLLVPHICRMIYGNNNKILLPASLIFGTHFMLIIDLISRTLTAPEIPVSIITALLGAPMFIFLLRKRQGGIL